MLYILLNLVNSYASNLNFYKNQRYNETETRREFIDPFFESFGWDMTNRNSINPRLREVMPENYLSSTSRPDYAFTLSGVKKFFVEAKKPSVNILTNMESIFQARSYGWSAGHLIVLLTNFEDLVIYDCTIPPEEGDTPSTALLRKYNYTDYVDKYDEISSLISRDMVYSGQFERSFEPLIETGASQSVDTYFLNQINCWRVELANYLKSNHPMYSLDFINDQTQTFINQMVFLRICEDRNLPIYHRLHQTLDDIVQLRESLNDIFRSADRKYNSGLFSGENIIFDLSNDIIFGMIQKLYYPHSPYVFNVIESNLLGQIYEMFLCERLTYINGEIVLTKKDEAVNRDIVITPVEIVKYMVKKTLETIVDGKSVDQIKTLKIADISCGSGVFLLETFDFLVQYCIQWYLANNPSRLIPSENGAYNLLFEDKRDILVSCIYGVDIDANAIEIAKFSLLVKLLEFETIPSLGEELNLLPNLDGNIVPGNALVDFSNIRISTLDQELKETIFPFDWEFANNTTIFDVIIGNPPYVTTEDMQRLLPVEEFAVYKKYKTAFKQFDKYFVFIERGVQKLKDNGCLCYIVPNKFAKIVSGEKLRSFITGNKYLVEYIDFGSAHLFNDNLTYSSILLLQKSQVESFVFEEVDDLQEWWAGQFRSSTNLRRVTFNNNIISEFPWVLVADSRKAGLANKLYSNTVPLNAVAKAINGIQTSAERPKPIYWFQEDEITGETEDCYRINRDNKEYFLEKAILRPYFKPVKLHEKKATTYDVINTNKKIIFPYNTEGHLFAQDEMSEKFPNAWQYLLDHYDDLLPKQISADGNGRDVPHCTSDSWYHYGRIQHLKSFNNTPKLIVRVMRSIDNPLYFYDDNDWLIAAGGTAGNCAIIEKEESLYALEFIQASLNHPAIGWLCSVIGSDFGGDFFSNGTSILNKLPIPNVIFEDASQMNEYEKVVISTRRIYSINHELNKVGLTTRQKSMLNAEKKNLIDTVRDLITKFYGIQEYMDIFN